MKTPGRGWRYDRSPQRHRAAWRGDPQPRPVPLSAPGPFLSAQM